MTFTEDQEEEEGFPDSIRYVFIKGGKLATNRKGEYLSKQVSGQ